MKSRKTNYAKRFDQSCSNHGSCPWCKGNRLKASTPPKLTPEETDLIAGYKEQMAYWEYQEALNAQSDANLQSWTNTLAKFSPADGIWTFPTKSDT